ncbi:Sin3 complex subunit [Pleurostoma richardsiae]|uniref:Sin3 complex subunit n=1 Tax=Pleurostoma richardsiae TaxID=41990 RepID=A0AA38RXZ0_9PEZI|nr:Sin3 complex subunit [Pleurostoma richardsiae]
MSFRFPLATYAYDPRAYREEDITQARLAAARTNSRGSTREAITPMAGDGKLERATTNSPSPAVSPAPQRRNVVFPDPVAFRYLEEDPSVKVVERRGVLQGYELYLIEQWACSRQSPTLVIVTYTGDPRHSVVVGVLAVPADEKDWSPRLRVYFKAIQQYHARPKETPLGELMVTNLNSFPSALTVIYVPEGDIRKYRQAFIVNEDLKRLGCAGRSGMTLSDPTPATQAKFLSMYKTSDRVPFFQAVIELVKLCQVALFIFGMLDPEYIDGLLCDVTETAIGNWWTEIGSEYYNIEPTDGILGPTTVAALLGMLMGARNRLSSYGAPVVKDVFDVEATKRGISTFQKAQKLERTRRLDRQTLLKLHSVTAKAAAGEGWGVQKAVKSTVAELGKRGEILSGMVSSREKAGISEIETLEFDRFRELVVGERAKWLWHGKPRRTVVIDHPEQTLEDMGTILFGKDDAAATQEAGRRTQSLPLDDISEAKKKEEQPVLKKKEESATVYSAPPQGSALSMADSPGEKDALRKAVFKSVAGKVSDARSGFGRIRDAVGGGLSRHTSRPSKDETAEIGYEIESPSISSLVATSGALSSPVVVGRAFTWRNKPEEYIDAFKKEREGDKMALLTTGNETSTSTSAAIMAGVEEPQLEITQKATEVREELMGNASVVGSAVEESDLQGPLLLAERGGDKSICFLKRRNSIALAQQDTSRPSNEARWPRRLSFGVAEEAVLRWEEIADYPQGEPGSLEAASAFHQQTFAAEIARSLYQSIDDIKRGVEPWVLQKVQAIESLDDAYGRQQEDIQSLYYQLSDAYQQVKQNSQEMMAEERAHVTEAVKDVEVLAAKLEYEINALVSKVKDVEDGVAQFETQVEDVEKRAEELKLQLETESWVHWFVRTLTGIGTGPNITASR